VSVTAILSQLLFIPPPPLVAGSGDLAH